MRCDLGKDLYTQFKRAHREREIAEKELGAPTANHRQSEHRMGKVQEVERGAANLLKRHDEACASCKADAQGGA